ncbi:MAG TPA: hypothetical protein VEK08_25615 [Planctomycetota bacterium]|nr:hypothetical protein [Planctomycetota bacterium]
MGTDFQKVKEEYVRKGLHGLSEAELNAPLETMFSAGLVKVWETRKALAFRNAYEWDENSRKTFERDKEKLGEKEAERRLQQRIQNSRPEFKSHAQPLWREISGLTPAHDDGEHPNERAQKVALLMENVERLLRYEIRAFERKMDERRKAGAQTPVGENDVRWVKQTHKWDPIRAICHELGIAEKKLSGFSKEINGLSIRELADVIRAEGLRAKLKAGLREFLFSRKDAKEQSKQQKTADEIYAELKASRRGPRFHRSSWAVKLGFSSYPRMFAACMTCYDKVPAELEIELLEELLKEASAEGPTCNSGQISNLAAEAARETVRPESEARERRSSEEKSKERLLV